jgi:hypothetical protein
MPEVGKMTVTVTIPQDKTTDVKTQILAALNSLKTAGKILYASWALDVVFEPESGTV